MALLSKLVVQVICVEAEGGRSVIKNDVQVGAELGDVQRLGPPDCIEKKNELLSNTKTERHEST